MISDLLAKFANGEAIKLNELTLAAETDHKDGRAKRKLEASQDCMLPHVTQEFCNFQDWDGASIEGDVRLIITNVSGEYIGATQKAEGVIGQDLTTLTKDSSPIARWTEDKFGKR